MRLNQILTIVFLVLLVPSVIKCVSGGIDITTAEERPKLFEGYNKDNVAIVEISKPVLDDQGQPKTNANGEIEKDAISLVKADGKWKIASGPYPGQLDARLSDVESRILDPLGKIEVSESSIIVADANDTTLESYKLDDKNAITVLVGNANRQPIATLLVGRSAGGADLGANATTGTYVRKDKQKVVILSDETLSLETDLDSWVNKTLLDISDEKEIVKLTLRNPKGEIVFEREDGDKPWKAAKQPEGTGAIRDSELTSLLGRGRYVSAMNFVTIDRANPVDHGLNAPKIELILETKDKKSTVLRIGNEVEGKQESYAHLSNHDGVLFTLASYDVDTLNKDPKELFDPKKAEETPKDGDKAPDDKKPDEKAPDEKKPDGKKTDGKKTGGDGK